MEGFKEAVLARLEILSAGIASFTESTNANLDTLTESTNTKMDALTESASAKLDAQNRKCNILIWMIGLFGGAISLILAYATFFAEQ